MPTLPLPPLALGIDLAGGDLPVAGPEDVAAEWSDDLPAGPVRDAIIDGETALFLAYQDAAGYAAAQSDPLRATAEYLDEIGDERGVHRQGSEDDAVYSPRVNATPALVSPNDILATVNAILAPYTSIAARYCERSDGLFLSSPGSAWSSHLFTDQAPVANDLGHTTPSYPDRRYAEILSRRPRGAKLFDDAYGRYFELSVPDISFIDSNVSALFDGTEPAADGFFLCDGTFAGAAVTYLSGVNATSSDIYNTIIGAVEPMRGQSMRWTLLVDPQLTA